MKNSTTWSANEVKNNWLLFLNIFPILFLPVFVFLNLRSFQTREETFTALYFSHLPTLPKHVEPGQDYDIEFTIHNKENGEAVYLYQLLIQTDQGEKILYEDNVLIAKDAIWSSKLAFRVESSFIKGKIILRLPNQDQQIYFRIFKK